MKKEIKNLKIEDVEDIREVTSRMIEEGNNKELSSTGTPMNKLNGAALYTARKAAIGGGSKETGGGGMEQGDRILEANKTSNAIIKIYKANSKQYLLTDKKQSKKLPQQK